MFTVWTRVHTCLVEPTTGLWTHFVIYLLNVIISSYNFPRNSNSLVTANTVPLELYRRLPLFDISIDEKKIPLVVICIITDHPNKKKTKIIYRKSFGVNEKLRFRRKRTCIFWCFEGIAHFGSRSFFFTRFGDDSAIFWKYIK